MTFDEALQLTKEISQVILILSPSTAPFKTIQDAVISQEMTVKGEGQTLQLAASFTVLGTNLTFTSASVRPSTPATEQ